MKLPLFYDAGRHLHNLCSETSSIILRNLHTSEQKVLPNQKIKLQNQNSPFSDIYALLTFYAAYNGSSLPIFRGNLSVLSSKIKHSSGQEVQDCLTLEDGPIGCPKISAVTL